MSHGTPQPHLHRVSVALHIVSPDFLVLMRGCSGTININMGPNKLLAQLTHMVIFVVRVAWGIELCDHTVKR